MVYRYRATIPGNKIFVREYEIRGSISLYALHLYLQNDLSFAPDQMVMFRGLDEKGKVRSEYGLFDLGDGSLDSVKLDDTMAKGEKTLSYVYDIYKDRLLNLEFISNEDDILRRSYPRLVFERGKNPDQFSDSYDDFDTMIDLPGQEDDGYNESDFSEEE